jgi:hypothetical protein
MPHVITTKSVVISTPVLDEKTKKPVTEEVKFGARKVTHEVLEHTQHEAGVIIEVSKALAKELIEAGHAREHLSGVDEDIVDPTKPSDDVLG